MRLIIVLLYTFCYASSTQAQLELSGKIVSSGAISYVSIGIMNTDFGCVSDVNGNFHLVIPQYVAEYKIFISHVSHIPVEMIVTDFITTLQANKGEFRLTERVVELKEIIVSEKRMKRITLGDTAQTNQFSITYRHSSVLGQELAKKIQLPKSNPAIIERVSISLNKNDLKKIVMRVNIYDDDGGTPGKKILKEDIIVTLKNGTLQIEADLSGQEIWVANYFYIAIEMLTPIDPNKFKFAAGLFKDKKIYQRNSSLGTWKSISGMGLACSVSLFQ